MIAHQVDKRVDSNVNSSRRQRKVSEFNISTLSGWFLVRSAWFQNLLVKLHPSGDLSLLHYILRHCST
jgi:hypothetical protein